jgi:Fe-S-cluster containining protein
LPVSGEQDCLQCGVCCEKWGWDQKGIPEDLVPWIRDRRTDILQHVGIRFRDGTRTTGKDLTEAALPAIIRIDYWVSPEGTKRTSCPFYLKKEDGKVYCRIHTTKPAVCIGFAPWAEVYHDYGLNCPACRDIAP